MLPQNAYRQFTPDMVICRILNGLWQVSGGHGAIEPTAAVREMFDYHDAGFVTWDLADHYGPAEDFIGAFRRAMSEQRGADALQRVVAFTKWVPRPTAIDRSMVERAVGVSLRRMGVETLDLLQFHWWEYRHPGYLDAMRYLAELRDAGKIRHVALTNFDTAHVRELTERGLRIVSNQVQYSIIDRRPEVQMADYCGANGITLLTYGTLCGGLLSDAYVNRPEPPPSALNTASLRKYKQMIDLWGGWTLFQELLVVLKVITEKYNVSVANVAVRYILEKPAVAGVIAGARLSVREHRADNARVFTFALDDDDRERIHGVTARSRDLFRAIGDCGDEYRR